MTILDLPVACQTTERRPRSRSRKLKWIRSLYIRDGRQCAYCGRPMMTITELEEFDYEAGKRLPANFPTLDHVIPRSEGGKTVLDNLVIACATCNNKKGNKATYIAKQQWKTFSENLGQCPECKGVEGSEFCRICLGSGELSTQRYHEVVDMLSREAKSQRKKAQQARARVRKLEEIVFEYEGSKPGQIKDREQLIQAIENLKGTVTAMATRIKELGGGRVEV